MVYNGMQATENNQIFSLCLFQDVAAQLEVRVVPGVEAQLEEVLVVQRGKPSQR